MKGGAGRISQGTGDFPRRRTGLSDSGGLLDRHRTQGQRDSGVAQVAEDRSGESQRSNYAGSVALSDQEISGGGGDAGDGTQEFARKPWLAIGARPGVS